MRRKIKTTILALTLSAMTLFSGCGIRFTIGLPDSALFKLNKNICSSSEASVFMLSQKKSYEAAYSSDIWDVQVEEQTFDEVMKDSLQDFLARMETMVLMADQYGVTITEIENFKIEQAAALYLSGISEETKAATGLDEETLKNVYHDYFLANKVLQQLTGEVNVEISEDEARVMQHSQIFFSFEGKTDEEKEAIRNNAKAVQEQAVSGVDFTALASKYNESKQTTLTLTRGELGEASEAAVFAMSAGEVSDVIETEAGLVILKCISNYDVDATAEHKAEMIRQRREDCFHEYYDSFLKTIVAQYNEKAWSKISYKTDFGEYTSDFYEIYNKYFET